MNLRKALLIALCAVVFSANADAAYPLLTEEGDSVAVNPIPKKRNIFQKFVHYFGDANKKAPTRKPNFSFIGGPHYSSDTELGLGVVGAGVYTTDETDPYLQPSNISIYGDICTVGFWLIGVRGTHIFPHDKYRIDYSTYFYSFPGTLWGIGYESCDQDSNAVYFKRFQMKAKVSFQWRIAQNIYLGPLAVFDFVRGKNPSKPELLNGQPLNLNNQGIGFTFVYDSRDVMTNAHQGYYVSIEQTFRPKFLGNDFAFSTTELNAAAYQRVWKGGVVGENLRASFNFGNPSWAMMALFASSNSMRGYYEGRYRDKHKFELQAELRQHVWRRIGVVGWVGVGSVFRKVSNIQFNHLLPNYGIGARWEFKKNMNVRLDYGWGKPGHHAFMFQMNEAF